MKEVKGGVCAPLGFQATGIHCGIRKNKTKKDLSLIVSDVMCHAASTYTLNKVKGAPIVVTKQHLLNGEAKAIICNSGNANTCNPNGEDIANQVCELLLMSPTKTTRSKQMILLLHPQELLVSHYILHHFKHIWINLFHL